MKLAAAVLIVAIGIGAFYYFGTEAAFMRGLVLAVAGIIALVVALTSTPGKAAVVFSRESYRELQKVVWPTRKETIQMTMVVISLVLIVALFLWAADSILLYAVKALTGSRS